MEKFIRHGAALALASAISLGLFARACSSAVDTAHATWDGGITDAAEDTPLTHPPAPLGDKPIPQTPASLDPGAARVDAGAPVAPRELSSAAPAAPPPPVELR